MKKIILLLITFFAFINSEQKKFNVGLCICATNKYIWFVPNLIKSAKKYFLINQNVTYFVFSNKKINLDKHIKIHYCKHKPWPLSTMQRFEVYYNNKDLFKDMDYIFACDADMEFMDFVNEEILDERVGVLHPYFWDDDIKGKTQYERNKLSTASISNNEGKHYFAGGFYGGTKKEFLKLVEVSAKSIQQDFHKNFIPIWHDESYLNRYFIDNPPTKILDPAYCHPQYFFNHPQKNFNFPKKLVALEKDHSIFRGLNES